MMHIAPTAPDVARLRARIPVEVFLPMPVPCCRHTVKGNVSAAKDSAGEASGGTSPGVVPAVAGASDCYVMGLLRVGPRISEAHTAWAACVCVRLAGEVLLESLVPTISPNAHYFLVMLAVFGTTISLYPFFWQATREQKPNVYDKDVVNGSPIPGIRMIPHST